MATYIVNLVRAAKSVGCSIEGLLHERSNRSGKDRQQELDELVCARGGRYENPHIDAI
jgi:hypothetical protein